MSSEYCICCGDIIPEGRQVCRKCENVAFDTVLLTKHMNSQIEKDGISLKHLTKGEVMNMKKRIFPALIIVAAIVLLFVAVLLLRECILESSSQRTQEKIRSLYYGKETSYNKFTFPSLFGTAYAEDDEIDPASTHSTDTDTVATIIPEIHDDFLALYNANADIVGWLTCGNSIDYPVVQRDNSFYLHNDFFGKHDANGTLFVNECNTFFPRDDVILIHGHNMKSGAMFGNLKYFEKYDYLCRYPIVTFRTAWDAENVYYTPIAAFNASMIPTDGSYFNLTRIIFTDDIDETSIPEDEVTMVFTSSTNVPIDSTNQTINNDYAGMQVPTLFGNESTAPHLSTPRKSTEFQSYIDELATWSLWKPVVDVKVDDDLLILVTCSYYHDDGRFMLVCRALREDETREDIETIYTSKLTN